MADSGSVDVASWAVVIATAVGPILAVQVQKAIEKIGENKTRKRMIFETLMATRSNRVAIDHVKALNMIDLTFNSKYKLEKDVLASWDTCRKHLNTDSQAQGFSLDKWSATGNELFYNLLHVIGIAVGAEFNREQLKTDYSPVGHGQTLAEMDLIRKNAVQLLLGKQSIKIELTQADAKNDLRDKLLNALDGGVLKIEIKKDDPKP